MSYRDHILFMVKSAYIWEKREMRTRSGMERIVIFKSNNNIGNPKIRWIVKEEYNTAASNRKNINERVERKKERIIKISNEIYLS